MSVVNLIVRGGDDNPADATPAKPRARRSGEMVLGSARLEAEAERTRGQDHLSPVWRNQAGAMAERVREPAPDYMGEVGAGGELVPASVCGENSRALEFRDTVQRPDYVTVDASRDRLELANAAGALEMGLDVAETIGAENSLEKMLAHQLAVAHRSTMEMSALVNGRVELLRCIAPNQLNMNDLERLNIETCRLAGTVTRMMGRFQQGVLTLQKLRTGGQQRVIVEQHHYNTQVQDGGQAMIAPKLKADRKGRGSRKSKGG
jgi:hypothetical protein